MPFPPSKHGVTPEHDVSILTINIITLYRMTVTYSNDVGDSRHDSKLAFCRGLTV